MSSAFERLQKIAAEKKKVPLELVPPLDSGKPPEQSAVNNSSEDVVYHTPATTVNHETEPLFTTDSNAVNNPTTDAENVNLLTTKEPKRGKQVDKITTNENVVNHTKRNWSTTDKKRSAYGGAVESFRTSEDFKQKIKVFCAENKIDKQDFYRVVVNHYFETAVNQIEENAVNLLTYDDRRLNSLYKTKPLIINLYLRYNSIFNEKTKWTVRDDDAGQKVNDLDLPIIELGIIQTQANKKFEGKINSFSYYLPEIRNFAELKMSADVVTAMLEINRQRWKQQTGKSIDLDFLSEK